MKTGAEILDDDTCWDLLATGNVGRVVFTDGDDIEVFPVNYALGGRSILFRSAPGSKLALVATAPRVAFEVDAFVEGDEAWSVIVWGHAERMSLDEEIETSGVLSLVAFTPAETNNFVQITPERISGRRFVADTDEN